MGAIDPDQRLLKQGENAASPWSANASTDGDIAPTPPSPCLNELGDDDTTPRQQWSPVHALVRARTQPSSSYNHNGSTFASSGGHGVGARAGRSGSGASKDGGESFGNSSRHNHNGGGGSISRSSSMNRDPNARPDSPVMGVDLERLDLNVLALPADETGGVVGGIGMHDRDVFASSGSASGAFIGGRPRSLGGRPSRTPALFVAPGHLGTGPSSPPSSYSTHSESGFGSPTRRLASPGPGSTTREIGRVRKGHWKKGKPIGVGSCGNVYLGMNEDTGELMAVKEITLEAKERLLCSLYNEIQVMHKLIHPHIVGYLGAELQDSQRKLCIFQEWVPAGSLHSLLDQFGALSDAMTRKYTCQVLEGLAYLHANRVIHRDVKSKNILVDDRGNVKLADFGCALVLKDDNHGGEGVEMSMKGTPLFMAPEMLLKRKCGRRVDVWSLGCAVIEMLTTRPPWADAFKHPVEIIAHFNENPGPPPIPSDLAPGLRHFLLSCFTWDPEARPSAQELCGHRYLQSRPVLMDRTEGTSPPEDVPLEEMDRVSAVTRMRRCSSATLDLLAVQARQATLGVSIGALATFGTAPSGTFRPPSPRYAPGGPAAHKRTPTRRRMYGSIGVTDGGPPPPDTMAPMVGSVLKGSNHGRTHSHDQSQGDNVGSTTPPAEQRRRRNSMPVTKSPPLSPEQSQNPEIPRDPEKSRELERARASDSQSRRPGRGGGANLDEDGQAGGGGRLGRGSCEEEGRISGAMFPPRLRGTSGERTSSSGSSGSTKSVGSGSDGCHGSENGVAVSSSSSSSNSSANRSKVPTPLSTPRAQLVGGIAGGVVDVGPISDTPPPMVRPLEHPSNSSNRIGEPSWSNAAQATHALLRRRGAGSKNMWGGARAVSDNRSGIDSRH